MLDTWESSVIVLKKCLPKTRLKLVSQMIQFLGINSLNHEFILTAFVRNVGEEEEVNAGFVVSFKRGDHKALWIQAGETLVNCWDFTPFLGYHQRWRGSKLLVLSSLLYRHHTSPVNLERNRFPRTKWRDLCHQTVFMHDSKSLGWSVLGPDSVRWGRNLRRKVLENYVCFSVIWALYHIDLEVRLRLKGK